MDNVAQNALTQRLARADHLSKRLATLQTTMTRVEALVESGLPMTLHFSPVPPSPASAQRGPSPQGIRLRIGMNDASDVVCMDDSCALPFDEFRAVIDTMYRTLEAQRVEAQTQYDEL
jgi:hypothetical protein